MDRTILFFEVEAIAAQKSNLQAMQHTSRLMIAILNGRR